MPDTSEVLYIKRNAQTAVEPVLSDEEISDLLQDFRIVDSEGRIITDAEYVPTYDLISAVADAWGLKAAKASGNYNFSDNGMSLSRSQVYDHCTNMQQKWLDRDAGSLDTTSTLIEIDITDIEIIEA